MELLFISYSSLSSKRSGRKNDEKKISEQNRVIRRNCSKLSISNCWMYSSLNLELQLKAKFIQSVIKQVIWKNMARLGRIFIGRFPAKRFDELNKNLHCELWRIFEFSLVIPKGHLHTSMIFSQLWSPSRLLIDQWKCSGPPLDHVAHERAVWKFARPRIDAVYATFPESEAYRIFGLHSEPHTLQQACSVLFLTQPYLNTKKYTLSPFFFRYLFPLLWFLSNSGFWSGPMHEILFKPSRIYLNIDIPNLLTVKKCYNFISFNVNRKWFSHRADSVSLLNGKFSRELL